jgi:hypothetical protein
MKLLMRSFVLLGAVLLTSACATSEEWAEWKSKSSHFASGQHGMFSLRNQKDDAKRVTRADVDAARSETWWGRAVSVNSDQIIQQ